jgi:hypothetical protein
MADGCCNTTDCCLQVTPGKAHQSPHQSPHQSNLWYGYSPRRARLSDRQRAEPDRWPPGFWGASRPFSEPPTRGRPGLAGAGGGDGKAWALGEASRLTCRAKVRAVRYRAALHLLISRPRDVPESSRRRKIAPPFRRDHNRGIAALARLELRARCSSLPRGKAAVFALSCRKGCISAGAPQRCRFCADLLASVTAGRSYTRDSLHALKIATGRFKC